MTCIAWNSVTTSTWFVTMPPCAKSNHSVVLTPKQYSEQYNIWLFLYLFDQSNSTVSCHAWYTFSKCSVSHFSYLPANAGVIKELKAGLLTRLQQKTNLKCDALIFIGIWARRGWKKLKYHEISAGCFMANPFTFYTNTMNFLTRVFQLV